MPPPPGMKPKRGPPPAASSATRGPPPGGRSRGPPPAGRARPPPPGGRRLSAATKSAPPGRRASGARAARGPPPKSKKKPDHAPPPAAAKRGPPPGVREPPSAAVAAAAAEDATAAAAAKEATANAAPAPASNALEAAAADSEAAAKSAREPPHVEMLPAPRSAPPASAPRAPANEGGDAKEPELPPPSPPAEATAASESLAGVETKEAGGASSVAAKGEKEAGKEVKKKKKKKGSTILGRKKAQAAALGGANAGADTVAVEGAKVRKKSRKSTLRKKKSTAFTAADAQAGGASPSAKSTGEYSPGKPKLKKASKRSSSKLSKRRAKTLMQGSAVGNEPAGSPSGTPRTPKKRAKKRASTMKTPANAAGAAELPPVAKKKKKKLRPKSFDAEKRRNASVDGTGVVGSSAAGEAPPPLRRRKGSRKSSKLAPPKSAVAEKKASSKYSLKSAASPKTLVAVVEEEEKKEREVAAAPAAVAASDARKAEKAGRALHASSSALSAAMDASAATSTASSAPSALPAESKPALGDIASLLLPSGSGTMELTPRAGGREALPKIREAADASVATAAARAAAIAALVPPTIPFDGSETDEAAGANEEDEEQAQSWKKEVQRAVQQHAVAERVADLEASGAAPSTLLRLPVRVASVPDSRERNAQAMAALTQAAHPGWPGHVTQSALAAPTFVPPAFGVLARRTSPIRGLRPGGARGGGGRSGGGVGGRACEFAALCVLLDDAVAEGAARCARVGVRAPPTSNAISSVDFERCIARSFCARDAGGVAIPSTALSRTDAADSAALRKLGSAIFALFDSDDSGLVDVDILKPFLGVVLAPKPTAQTNAPPSAPGSSGSARGTLVAAPGRSPLKSPLARAGRAITEIASALRAVDGGGAGGAGWSGGGAQQQPQVHLVEDPALADGGQWEMSGVDNHGDEWVCVRTAASGMLPYWYNRRTNASSWTPPLELVEEAAARSCGMLGEHSAWTRLHDPETSTPYWFNRVTCVSQWSPPPPTVRALSPEKLQRWADGARKRVVRRELRALKDDARRSAHAALCARAEAAHNRPPGLSPSLGRARVGGAPGGASSRSAPSTPASPRVRLRSCSASPLRATGAPASSYERTLDDAVVPGRSTSSSPLSTRGALPGRGGLESNSPDRWAPDAVPVLPQREGRNARLTQLREARIERREADRAILEHRTVHPAWSATRGGVSPSRRPRREPVPLRGGSRGESGGAPQLTDLDSIWAEFDAHLDRLSGAGMSTSRWEERPTSRTSTPRPRQGRGARGRGSRSPSRRSTRGGDPTSPGWSDSAGGRSPVALRSISPLAQREDIGGERFRAQSKERRETGFEVGATSLAMSAVSRSLQLASPKGGASPSASTFRPIAGWPKRKAQ